MPSTSGKRLTSNILALYILQGLNYIVPMLVLPFLVRVLGIEQYGLMALAQSFAQYFTLLTDYGFNLSATRSIVPLRDSPAGISKIFSAVLFIKVALLLLGIPILTGILMFVPSLQQNAAFFAVAYLGVVGNVLFPNWFFQGIEQMRYISILIGASRILGAAALFIFVHKPADALLALLIQTLSLVVGGVLGLLVAINRFKVLLVVPTRTDLRVALAEGWHLFVSTAAVSLYTNTNVFLVGLLVGNTEAGYFSAAEKLIRALQGLMAPVSQALFPHMNTLVAKSRQAALDFALETLRWIGGITALGSFLLFAFAHPIVQMALGKSAYPAATTLRWIAPLPFIIAVSNVLGIQIMIPFGLDKAFSRLLIGAGVLNVVLGLVLIPHSGATGAGQAVLLTELSVTCSMIWILYRSNTLNLERVNAS